jgi:signal transduction histidine kinase
LRFNDLMQTVLAAEDRTGLGAVTLWRQCVDLLAQHDRADRTPLDQAEREALLNRLAGLRSRISETQRIATVVELGSRLRSPALVSFFAHDRPAIAAAAIARAQIPDDQWAALLPELTPTARGVLRGRRDCGPLTRQALEAFGRTDLVLTTDAPTRPVEDDMLLTRDMMAAASRLADPSPEEDLPYAPAPQVDGSQIRNLVDRIERFTSGRRRPDPAPPPAATASAPPPKAPTPSFSFETDAAGAILWVDQGSRAALIGLSLADVALDGGSGPDGHVAGAFARRSGFRNGRYTIADGAMAGEWRMTATPFFDPRSGRFQGFRGQARRPHLHEVAAPAPAEGAGIAGLSADSLRQLVHELRTPLNAILGFAEIIEQQIFGATGPEYRDMAGKIAVDARHLLHAFDDLDLAARVARGDERAAPRAIDPGLLVTQVVARFADAARDAGPGIDIHIAADLPPVRIDPVQGERMVQHLLRTLISVAPAAQPLTGACWSQPDGGTGRILLAIDRPSTLAGLEEAQLLDPGYTPDGEWADGPLLGVGFSLRLVRSLAVGCGGSLDVEPARFVLALPAAPAMDERANGG